MSGPMPKEELRQHRSMITEFLAAWGYYLPRGSILPAQFKHCYGLNIDFKKSMAITDLPSLSGQTGQTSEYFLRDCLEAAHESLWRSIRCDFIDKRGDHDNHRHWDSNRLGHWASLLMADESKAITGKFTQQEHHRNCNVDFTGCISGSVATMKIEGSEVQVETTLPTTVINSISMQYFGDLFDQLPQCSDEKLNQKIAQMYVMKAEQRDNLVVFHMLDGCTSPMPGHEPSDLWRRIREAKPDTVMLQFPPHCDWAETYAKAAEHRVLVERFLAELTLNERTQYDFPPAKAAA